MDHGLVSSLSIHYQAQSFSNSNSYRKASYVRFYRDGVQFVQEVVMDHCQKLRNVYTISFKKEQSQVGIRQDAVSSRHS